MTLKWDCASCRGRPPTPTTAVAVVGSSDWRHQKEHHDGQVSDATVVTQNWSSCYLREVDGMAALCCRMSIYSVSFRWQMTVVEIIIANLHCLSNGQRLVGLMFVHMTVAVYAVCAGEQCTWETCVHAWYRTPTHSGCQRRSAVT